MLSSYFENIYSLNIHCHLHLYTDLNIIYRIHPHKRFQRVRALDLVTIVDVDFWDCILGTHVPIKHIDGDELMLRIPERTRPSAQLRLKGQGIQKDRQAGDLYVKLNAVTIM